MIRVGMPRGYHSIEQEAVTQAKGWLKRFWAFLCELAGETT